MKRTAEGSGAPAREGPDRTLHESCQYAVRTSRDDGGNVARWSPIRGQVGVKVARIARNA